MAQPPPLKSLDLQECSDVASTHMAHGCSCRTSAPFHVVMLWVCVTTESLLLHTLLFTCRHCSRQNLSCVPGRPKQTCW